MDQALTAFVTLFVVIDPIGLAPIFISLTQGVGAAERRRIAVRATAIAAAILTLFGLAGQQVIETLGIGLPAFRIAGGLMLFLIALEMLFERRDARRSAQAGMGAGAEEADGDTDAAGAARSAADDPSAFPLATPLIAGPGAMAAMILLAANAGDALDHALIFAAMAAVLGLALMLFLAAPALERALGPVGVKLATRLLGVLLGALAVQFVLDGLADFGFVRAAAGE